MFSDEISITALSEPIFLHRALGEGFLKEVVFIRQVGLGVRRWGLGGHESMMESGSPGRGNSWSKGMTKLGLFQN